jgi:hypothetical protein
MRKLKILPFVSFAALILWFNYIGITLRTYHSADGRHLIRVSTAGWSENLVRLHTSWGWPRYSEFHETVIGDSIPTDIEWFEGAVGLIDHFDLGAHVKVIDLSTGNEPEYDSTLRWKVQEALRWKYSFSDYRHQGR